MVLPKNPPFLVVQKILKYPTDLSEDSLKEKNQKITDFRQECPPKYSCKYQDFSLGCPWKNVGPI